MPGEVMRPFPYDHFLNYFPEFKPKRCDDSITPEFIIACGSRASMYLSDFDSVWLKGERRLYAHCLLAAHIVYLTNKVKKETAGGGDAAVGPVTNASVGGVSVGMQTPTSSQDGAFEWWLNKSPYGQEFLAIIRTRGPMLAYIGSKTPVLPLR